VATYVSTVKFTNQGMVDIKDTCQRARKFMKAAKKTGVEVHDILWTLGPFDGLIVFDAPDDQTATALMLQLCSGGNVQTQTSLAYRVDEMENILGKMSE